MPVTKRKPRPKQKRARAKSAEQEMAERIAAIDRLYGFFPRPRRAASIADMQRAIEKGASERAGYKPARQARHTR